MPSEVAWQRILGYIYCGARRLCRTAPCAKLWVTTTISGESRGHYCVSSRARALLRKHRRSQDANIEVAERLEASVGRWRISKGVVAFVHRNQFGAALQRSRQAFAPPPSQLCVHNARDVVWGNDALDRVRESGTLWRPTWCRCSWDATLVRFNESLACRIAGHRQYQGQSDN